MAGDLDEFEVLRRGLSADLVSALERALPVGAPPRRDPRRSVWDVLVDGLDVRDVRAALQGVRAGAGGELKPTKRGNLRFCSAESSALMAVNLLAPFNSRGGLLGLSGGALSFEHELRVTGVRSRAGPTMDAVFESAHGSVLIEVKTAETWRAPPTITISREYDAAAAATSSGMLATLLGLRDGSIAYRCLDAAQLLKHLLGANDALRDGRLQAPARLVLLFWQPATVGLYSSLFSQLAAELDDFARRVADQPVEVGRMSTATLLDEWSEQGGPRWLRQHAEELRRRYDVELPGQTGVPISGRG